MGRKHYYWGYREQFVRLMCSRFSIASGTKEFRFANHKARDWVQEAQEGSLDSRFSH